MPRTFVVTLLGNIKKTITLDIGADTPLDQIKLPRPRSCRSSASRRSRRPGAPPGGTASLSIKPTAPARGTGRSGVARRRAPRAGCRTSPSARPARRSASPRAGRARVFDTAGRLRDARSSPSATARAKTQLRFSNGIPTLHEPDDVAGHCPGPVPVGVPNFFINKFRIPPFLLPIYQAAGIQYGIRWEVLAAINEIETDYGRNLNVSLRRRDGLDAVHPVELEALRRRRQRRRQEGPLQPGRRDLRGRALPQGGGRRAGSAQGDLRLQPRRLVRRLRAHAGALHRRHAVRPRRLAERPDAGPASRSMPRRSTPTTSPSARPTRRVARGKNAALPVEANTTRRGINIFAKAGLAGRRRPGRQDRQGRPERAPRQLRDAARRLRQHLHLRAA